MFRCALILLCSLLFVAETVLAAGLPDTGVDICYNDTVADSVAAINAASISRDAGTHPRQDCRYGSDAAAVIGLPAKTGGGPHGFDYTKITNASTSTGSGTALGTGAFDWACTRDNITGLMWEVKTAGTSDLRYSGHTYAWYSTDGATNGGDVGNQGSNTCSGTLPGNLCNTQAFATAVNAAALCTYNDWRLPTLRELLTLVDADGSSPAIAAAYFPNTSAAGFWSGTPISESNPATRSYYVGFFDGEVSGAVRLLGGYVRLVRGGSF